jgi:hypothetical protein
MSESFVKVEERVSKVLSNVEGNFFIWSTGAESHDLFNLSKFEVDDLGFMLVNDSL